MRVLWVSPVSLVPQHDGNSLRNYHLLRAVAQHHAVLVVCPEGPDPKATRRMLRSLGCDPRTVPEVSPPATLPHRLWRRVISTLAVRPHCLLPPSLSQLVSNVERTSDGRAFDVAVGGLYVIEALLAANTQRLVLDCQNVEGMLYERLYRAEPPGLRRISRYLDWVAVRNYEQKHLPRARVVTVCSEADGAEFRRVLPALRQVEVIPNGADCTTLEKVHPYPGSRTIVFVGGLSYAPNVGACVELVTRVMPLVWRQHPDAEVVLVGKSPAPEVRSLAGERVRVTGEVDDVTPYLAAAAVAVVPLRVGGGTRLKIVEAMGAGLPVVATSLAVEGLGVGAADGVLVYDRIADFAAAVSDLLADPSRRSELGRLGRLRCAADFDWLSIGRRFCRLLETP